jgi:hypothetical protein
MNLGTIAVVGAVGAAIGVGVATKEIPALDFPKPGPVPLTCERYVSDMRDKGFDVAAFGIIGAMVAPGLNSRRFAEQYCGLVRANGLAGAFDQEKIRDLRKNFGLPL